MTNDDEMTNDDALWYDEVHDVQPLDIGRSKNPLSPSKTKNKLKQANRSVSSFSAKKISSKNLSNDIDARTLQRLKRGQIKIEARLDFHGLSRIQAYDRLYPFLENAQKSGKRCVLVITGKRQSGYELHGVLRESLPEWLTEPRYNALVLTHLPAQARHGGAGAFYIYLRRRK